MAKFIQIGNGALELSPPTKTKIETRPSSSRILCISNKFGFLACGYSGGFLVGFTRDFYFSLLDGKDFSSNIKRNLIPNGQLHHLELSIDETVLIAVVGSSTHSSILRLYNAFDLLHSGNGTEPFLSVEVEQQILQISPHPSDENLLLIVTAEKQFKVYSISERSFLEDYTISDIVRFCFSSDSLYVGKSTGSVDRHLLDGFSLAVSGVKSFDGEIRHLSWNSGSLLAGTILDDNVVKISLGATEFTDICFVEGETVAFHQISFMKWKDADSTLVFTFGSSSDSFVLTNSSNTWEPLDLDETARMEMPLPKSDSIVAGCLGLAVDLTNKEVVAPKHPEDPIYPASPLVFVITSEESLLGYRVYQENQKSTYPGMIKNIEILKKPEQKSLVGLQKSNESALFEHLGSKTKVEIYKPAFSFSPAAKNADYSQAITFGQSETKQHTFSSPFGTAKVDQHQESASKGNDLSIIGEKKTETFLASPPKLFSGFGSTATPSSDIKTSSLFSNTSSTVVKISEELPNSKESPAITNSFKTAIQNVTNEPKHKGSLEITKKVAGAPVVESQETITLSAESAEFLHHFNEICTDIARDIADFSTSHQHAGQKFEQFLVERNDDDFEERIAEMARNISSTLERTFSQENSISELKEGLLSVYSRLAEAESYIKAMSKFSLSRTKLRKLPPEQADQQRKIRSMIQEVSSRLEDIEEYAFHLKEILDNNGDDSKMFSMDSIYRTMKNINCTALLKSTEIDQLLRNANSMISHGFISQTKTFHVNSPMKQMEEHMNVLALSDPSFKQSVTEMRDVFSKLSVSSVNKSTANEFEYIITPKNIVQKSSLIARNEEKRRSMLSALESSPRSRKVHEREESVSPTDYSSSPLSLTKKPVSFQPSETFKVSSSSPLKQPASIFGQNSKEERQINDGSSLLVKQPAPLFEHISKEKSDTITSNKTAINTTKFEISKISASRNSSALSFSNEEKKEKSAIFDFNGSGNPAVSKDIDSTQTEITKKTETSNDIKMSSVTSGSSFAFTETKAIDFEKNPEKKESGKRKDEASEPFQYNSFRISSNDTRTDNTFSESTPSKSQTSVFGHSEAETSSETTGSAIGFSKESKLEQPVMEKRKIVAEPKEKETIAEESSKVDDESTRQKVDETPDMEKNDNSMSMEDISEQVEQFQENTASISNDLGGLGFGTSAAQVSANKSPFSVPNTNLAVSSNSTFATFSSTQSNSIFGSKPAATFDFSGTATEQKYPFAPSNSTIPTAFARASTPSKPAAFEPTSSATPPAFSAPSTNIPSAFGGHSSSSGAPAFGQSSFGTPKLAGAFGQPSFGTSGFSQPSFGQPSLGQSGFGQSGSTATQRLMAGTNVGKVFGSDIPLNRGTTGNFGTSAFGSQSQQSFGTSSFGQAAAASTQTNVFGNSSGSYTDGKPNNPNFSQFR